MILKLARTITQNDFRFMSVAYVPKTTGEHELMQIQPPDLPENPCLLKVALLGEPNSGKSTIFNNLLGRKISPVSARDNTTRHRITGVFTDGDNQVVFLDTPGIFPPWRLKKRVKLEKSVVMDPLSSLWDADLVMVVHDIGNSFGRNRIGEELLKCLFSHPDKESILVLNKVDMLKRKKGLLEITRKLTDGKLNGKPYMPTPGSEEDLLSRKLVDPELVFKRTNRMIEQNRQHVTPELLSDIGCTKEEMKKLLDVHGEFKRNGYDADVEASVSTHETLAGSETATEDRSIVKLDSAEELESVGTTGLLIPEKFHQDLMDTSDYHLFYQKLGEVGKFVRGVQSWPYFDQVFMVSAKKNDGLDALKRYLISRCRPAPWWFHRSILTDQYPQDIAMMFVREKMFEMLPNEIPYSLNMEVEKWNSHTFDDTLFITIVIHPRRRKYTRDVGILLKRNGEAIKAIANAAQNDLMDLFRCDVCLRLNVALSTK